MSNKDKTKYGKKVDVVCCVDKSDEHKVRSCTIKQLIKEMSDWEHAVHNSKLAKHTLENIVKQLEDSLEYCNKILNKK